MPNYPQSYYDQHGDFDPPPFGRWTGGPLVDTQSERDLPADEEDPDYGNPPYGLDGDDID